MAGLKGDISLATAGGLGRETELDEQRLSASNPTDEGKTKTAKAKHLCLPGRLGAVAASGSATFL